MGKIIDYSKYADIARKASAEGIVLLKNDGHVLPVRAGTNISVFGRIQSNYYKSGTGSGGMVNVRYTVSILDALLERQDFGINETVLDQYRNWEQEHPFDYGNGWGSEPWAQEEMPLEEGFVQKAAEKSDLALIIIGRTAGEDQDIRAERGSYLLSEAEEEMIRLVTTAFVKTVVVLNTAGIMDMQWVEVYQPSAVLMVWQGGMEGGHAAVDVLTGKINPCGRLSDTIAYHIADYPSSANFGSREVNYYEEDIYVGYRYFETFCKEKVQFPFGYGLSYTAFEQSVEALECCGGEITAYVKVTNTGQYPGKDVVQMYVSAPQGKLGKPKKVLADFGKTRTLNPWESEILKLHCTGYMYASYDESGAAGFPSSYVLEEGKYRIFIGENVRDCDCKGAFDIPEILKIEVWDGKISEEAPRMEEAEECTYRGNLGYQFVDVKEKRVSLGTFLTQISEEGLAELVCGEGMCSLKVTPGTAGAFGGVTEELKSFGIPIACCSDGPSGIRMDSGEYAFSIPNGTNLACTFDVELVERLFEMMGMELLANRIDLLLGPGMNIHRNPLNGRNFEYFSEDPLLSGRMAAAEISGMQKYGVSGVLKHFAANNQEYARETCNAVISERALREIYLRGFEIAVKEAKAKAVMTSYGPINGIWSAGNRKLLTQILREEWGFDGLVMTDWWAMANEPGKMPFRENTVPMLLAQNDLYMVVSDAKTSKAKENVLAGIKEGRITRRLLVRSAKNICNVLLELPAMRRLCGEEEACQKPQFSDHTRAADVQRVGESCRLSIEELKEKKKGTVICELNFTECSVYDIRVVLEAEQSVLAQLPVSLFLNGALLGTHLVGGNEKEEWVLEGIEVNAPTQYLKIYRGQNGIGIPEIEIGKS